MTGLSHPMDQGPADPSDAAPPSDPATLAEARAEREEQGRVVLVRARAMREAIERMDAIPLPFAGERLSEAGEERANRRATASLSAAEAWDRLREADEDLARIERRLARLEAEQGAPPLDDAAYARARAAGLADRDDARGAAVTMRRAA